MAPSAQDVPPEVNPKWLELRQKHQEESNAFQAMVNRNREEFEARVDRQRKDLLAQHSKEEREFWSKNARTGAVRAETKAKFARTQTPRGSVAPSKKTASPASRPATSRMSVQPPVTPARPTQHPRYADVPPAPKRSTQHPASLRKSGKPEIIDLCSDDDDDPYVTKKQPVVQMKTAQKPAAQPPNARNATGEDAMDIDEVQTQPSDPFSMPEATLELFGGSSLKPFSTPIRPTIKNEFSSPKLAGPFAKMGMSNPKTPGPEPASPSTQPATTATRQLDLPEMLGSRASSSVPSLRYSAAGFMDRAASALPVAFSGLNGSSPFKQPQPDNNAAANISLVGHTGRPASSAPPAFSPVQKWPSSSKLRPTAKSESLPWANLGGQNQQLRECSVISHVESTQENGHNSDVQDNQEGRIVEQVNVEMQDVPMSEVIEVPTSSPSSSFKKPNLPASAAPSTVCRPIAAGARHIRAGTTDSRASSSTLPASPDSQRGASVTSGTSLTSPQTSATQSRKRRMVVSSLSDSDSDSDSQSDFAPSGNASPIDDDESSKPAKHAHTAKKSKANDGAEVLIKAKPRVQTVMGKNGMYGFKFAPTLGKPARSSKTTARPATDARRTSTSKTVKKTPAPQFTKRRAAVAAKDKIQGIFDSNEEFQTELAIQEADHIESAHLPEGLGRMSLTPSPPDENSVDALAEPGSFREWSQVRSTGDRKAHLRATVDDEDDSEVDVDYDIGKDGSWKARR